MKANLKSQVIGIIHTGNRLKIISAGKKENINPWGNFNWYEVEYIVKNDVKNVWIFGAFLEPVEQKMK